MPTKIRNRLDIQFFDTSAGDAARYLATDEVERCALLAEALATVHELKADEFRKLGAYSTRSIWPPFRVHTFIKPGYQREIDLREQAAGSLRTIAKCMRLGYDHRDLSEPPSPDARINIYAQQNATA